MGVVTATHPQNITASSTEEALQVAWMIPRASLRAQPLCTMGHPRSFHTRLSSYPGGLCVGVAIQWKNPMLNVVFNCTRLSQSHLNSLKRNGRPDALQSAYTSRLCPQGPGNRTKSPTRAARREWINSSGSCSGIGLKGGRSVESDPNRRWPKAIVVRAVLAVE